MRAALGLLGCLILIQSGPAGWTCNSTYKKCYQRQSSLVPFSTAQSNCAPAATGQAGSKLAEPSFSNGESSYIFSFVPSVPSNNDQQVIWLGVIRQSGANWAYASNTATTFAQSNISPWGQGQPDWTRTGQSHLCLARYRSWSSTGFDDGSPGASKYPLCEVACT